MFGMRIAARYRCRGPLHISKRALTSSTARQQGLQLLNADAWDCNYALVGQQRNRRDAPGMLFGARGCSQAAVVVHMRVRYRALLPAV